MADLQHQSVEIVTHPSENESARVTEEKKESPSLQTEVVVVTAESPTNADIESAGVVEEQKQESSQLQTEVVVVTPESPTSADIEQLEVADPLKVHKVEDTNIYTDIALNYETDKLDESLVSPSHKLFYHQLDVTNYHPACFPSCPPLITMKSTPSQLSASIIKTIEKPLPPLSHAPSTINLQTSLTYCKTEMDALFHSLLMFFTFASLKHMILHLPSSTIAYFKKWRGQKQPLHKYLTPWGMFWAFIGSFAGIAFPALINFNLIESRLDNTELLFILGSFGASAVLLFSAPQADFAQPRSVLGGNIVSAIVGVLIRKIFSSDPDHIWLACTLSVALAILAMNLTRTLHPPGRQLVD